MRPRRLATTAATLAAAVALAAGCEEKINLGNSPPKAAPAPPKDTFIVGKRTQAIDKFDADAETKKGGAVASQKIVAKDPITLSGNAYVTMIGRTSILQIEHAMNLYKASNDDKYPKDFDEFMNGIIKPNNIALPQLPHYQKYAYDEKEHKLIVIEYPH